MTWKFGAWRNSAQSVFMFQWNFTTRKGFARFAQLTTKRAFRRIEKKVVSVGGELLKMNTPACGSVAGICAAAAH